MHESFRESFKRDFSRLFSNNKRKLVEKLSPSLGDVAAIALIGNERNSRTEIEVVADIVSNLRPLDIWSYKLRPNKAILVGRSYQGNLVRVHPQFRIQKPQRITANNQIEYWYVDLAIQVFSRRDEGVCIGLWGCEYDGHPAHFVESGIIKSQFRDVVMENEIGMRPIHITKEYWSKHPREYIRNLLTYIDRRNFDTDSLSEENLKLSLFNIFEAPELDLVGEGPVKQGISWECLEISE